MAKGLPEASSGKRTWSVWAASEEEPPTPEQNMTGCITPAGFSSRPRSAHAAGTASWGNAYLPYKGSQGLEQMGAGFPAPPGHTGLQRRSGQIPSSGSASFSSLTRAPKQSQTHCLPPETHLPPQKHPSWGRLERINTPTCFFYLLLSLWQFRENKLEANTSSNLVQASTDFSGCLWECPCAGQASGPPEVGKLTSC